MKDNILKLKIDNKTKHLENIKLSGHGKLTCSCGFNICNIYDN